MTTTRETCRHETSLYGRCADCGMPWAEQQTRSEAEIRAAADVRADEEDRDDPVRSEAERLTREWNDALAAYRRDDSARSFEAEQTAYDALVDFVEENDLNYSEFDPRGPEEAQQL